MPFVWVKSYETLEGSGDSVQMVQHPGGWKSTADVSEYEVSFIGAPPANAPNSPGEVAELLNPDVKEESLGLGGPLYKASDGYYVGGKKADNVTDSMIPDLLSGATTRQNQAIEANKNDHTIEMVALAGFGGLAYLGYAAAASAAAGGTAAAATAAPAATATPGLLSNTMVKAGLTGAAKSAAVSTGVQLATTGKVDLKKVGISAVAGGFGGLVGDWIRGIPGQIAGAVGGAVVGAALTPDSKVSGAISGGSGAITGGTGATVNPAGLTFNSPGLINAQAPRTTDWSTPRLDWAGTGAK